MNSGRKNYLYTFIMDFRGGTYISQIRAPNKEVAVTNWARNLNFKEITHFGIKTMMDLEKELGNERMTPIAGNTNIWELDLIVKGHFTIIYVIKTYDE